MSITFGDYLIDSGYREPEEEDMPDPEAQYQSLLNEFSQQRALLHEALVTMKHARVFIGSREKMHPTGISLYDDLVEQIERAQDGASQQTTSEGK